MTCGRYDMWISNHQSSIKNLNDEYIRTALVQDSYSTRTALVQHLYLRCEYKTLKPTKQPYFLDT
jgi:hypothetical protein